MTTSTVYSSTHPDVVGWWEGVQEAWRTYERDRDALLAEYPGFAALVENVDGGRGRKLSGLVGDSPIRDNPPPSAGWRLYTRGDTTFGWVPRRNTKLGKALAAQFDAVSFKPGHAPGMPYHAVADGHWYHPGFLAHDGVVWSSWSCDAAIVEAEDWGGPPDFELWQRSKLSAYYTAKEARDEAHAAKQDATASS